MIKYKIREVLASKGITQVELKEATGIKVSNFEDGRPVYTDTIDKVCEFLKVEPYMLFEIVDDETGKEASEV